MKKRWLSLTTIFILLAALFLQPHAVRAARGTPQSPDFGYGVRLELLGNDIDAAMQTAALLQVDWIIIDLDWGRLNPEANDSPDLTALDQAMEYAHRYEIPVAISLMDAPAWAKNSAGPDPDATARFTLKLAQQYTQSLQAIELFPGANTLEGWGSTPDPAAYFSVFSAAQNAIKEADLSILLVAAGLTPLPSGGVNGDIDDSTFLEGLYQAGAGNRLPVISLRLKETGGEPSQVPDGTEHRILRHYEEIRQVMLDNGDAKGILWITSFTWNTGKNQVNDVSLKHNLEDQSKWLDEAYLQLKSQLYIGVAFLTSLNTPQGGGESTNYVSLNLSSKNEHPFYFVLKDLIVQNSPSITFRLSFDTPQQKHIVKLRSDPP